jgi:cytochrome b involved in lipid metabolism
MDMRVLILFVLLLSMLIVACTQQTQQTAQQNTATSGQSPPEVSPQAPPQQDNNITEPVTPPVQKTPSASAGYVMADVAKHNSQGSCWTVVNGEVYDVTSYVSKHPGGQQNILRLCGKDGTSLFENKHGGMSRPEAILTGLKVGNLN